MVQKYKLTNKGQVYIERKIPKFKLLDETKYSSNAKLFRAFSFW
jgi:hypothetical protein